MKKLVFEWPAAASLFIFLVGCIAQPSLPLWQSEQDTITFNILRGGQPQTQALTITNLGDGGTLSILSAPDWLSLTPKTRLLAENESTQLELTAQPCEQQALDDELTIKADEGVVVLGNDDARLTIIAIRQCELPKLDFALERIYFMQSTTQLDSLQLPEEQIPLVAGREAIIRAFVSEVGNSSGLLPQVHFHYILDDGSQNSLELQPPDMLSNDIDESFFSTTYNARIPADIILSSTRYWVSVDDNNRFAERSKENNSYPIGSLLNAMLIEGNAQEKSTLALKARPIPTMEIVILPIVVKGFIPDTSKETLDGLLRPTYSMMPLSSYSYEVYEPLAYDGENWAELLQLIENVQFLNQDTNKYYLGLVGRPLSFGSNGITTGIGYVGFKTSAALPLADTIAHEFGHNFGRFHSPCGMPARIDPQYPYPIDTIGAYGLDTANNYLMFKDGNNDIMSYCEQQWISDYTYRNIINTLSQERTNTNKTLQKIENTAITPYTLSGEIFGQSSAIVNYQWPNIRNLRDDLTTVKRESDRQGPYQLVAVDRNDDVVVTETFFTYSPDHAENQFFSATIEIGNQQLAMLSHWEIHYQNQIIGEAMVNMIPTSDKQSAGNNLQAKALLSAPPPSALVSAVRAGRIVKVNWPSRHQAVIRNAGSQAILAIADSGAINLNTDAQELVIRLSDGSTFEVNVD